MVLEGDRVFVPYPPLRHDKRYPGTPGRLNRCDHSCGANPRSVMDGGHELLLPKQDRDCAWNAPFAPNAAKIRDIMRVFDVK